MNTDLWALGVELCDVEDGRLVSHLFVLQEAEGSKRKIANLNVAIDSSKLCTFSSILSG